MRPGLQGDPEGIDLIHHGLAGWRAAGAGVAWTHYQALLAQAYTQHGQLAQGLAALTEALTTAHTTGELFYEAELHRLQGELLWQQNGPVQEVEVCFKTALQVARRQQAKLPELRAAMALSRLYLQQGRPAGGYRLMAGLVAWFTETAQFDLPDLQAATALLTQLPPPANTPG